MQTYPTHDNVRLCKQCHLLCSQSKRPTNIRVLLVGLDPSVMCRLSCVSRSWKHANTVMVYKGIPYKLSHSRYSSLERNIMKSRQHTFARHTCWTIQCARINIHVKGKRRYSCRQLMCSQDCSEHLEPRHVLNCCAPSRRSHPSDTTLRNWIRNTPTS